MSNISFNFLTEIPFGDIGVPYYVDWITRVIESEGYTADKISFVFADDDYVWRLNKEYLKHDYYTDILTFDYTQDKKVQGEIYISIDRVLDNARDLNVNANEELRRVMAHGILHMVGYDDHEESDIIEMRNKEDEKLKMFHVEQ